MLVERYEKEMEKIHVCYALTDRNGGYTKIAGTSICSLLLNTSKDVVIHLLHDESLNEDNITMLRSMVEKQFHQELKLYNIYEDYRNIWNEILEIIPELRNSRLSIATFFRLVLGDVFADKIDRLIYLDADIIVNMDIDNLWRKEVSESGVAAAPDIVLQKIPHKMCRSGVLDTAQYFNAGVLLIDIKKYCEVERLLVRSIEFLKRYNPEYLDQDVLNYFFPKSCVLSSNYNTFVNLVKNRSVSNCIYHYVNNCIGFDMSDPYNRLFFSYFSQTPWYNESFIWKFFSRLNGKYEGQKYILFRLANICAGKRRIAVSVENAKEAIIKLMELKSGERCCAIEDVDSLLINFDKNKDVFVLFLSGEEYYGLKEKLEGVGLVENINFVYGMVFFDNILTNGYDLFLNS